MAEKAGKAAPAMAIAGALVAAPQALHAFAKPAAAAVAHSGQPAAAHEQATPATLDSVVSRGSAAASAASASGSAASTATRTAAVTSYTVRAGDTLSQIADRYYHNAGDWPWLYHENDTTIKNPNLIYAGQVLRVPANPPASAVVDSYIPRHAKPATTVSASVVSGSARSGSTAASSGDSDDSGASQAIAQPARQGSGGSAGPAASRGSKPASGGSGSTTMGGTLGCSGLEQLWVQAGGNPANAFMAAEIAMAESGGNQYALSPTNDYGYWQINASNGSLATFSAYGNARAAVIISHNGTNWNPWTTYTSGAYAGRC